MTWNCHESEWEAVLLLACQSCAVHDYHEDGGQGNLVSTCHLSDLDFELASASLSLPRSPVGPVLDTRDGSESSLVDRWHLEALVWSLAGLLVLS